MSIQITCPENMPETYIITTKGDCMLPELGTDTKIVCSREEPYAIGDMVVLYFRPEMVKPGYPTCLVKRLVMVPPPWVTFPYSESPTSEIKAVVFVESLNPRRNYSIRCAHLLGIHKCLGPVPAETVIVPSTAEAVRACTAPASPKLTA